MFTIDAIKRQFPALSEGLVYLDSAATTQKPQCVIEALADTYATGVANPNRGVHPLAESMTDKVEEARRVIARHLGADAHEVIFTRGTTESINLVARSLGETLKKGDRIAVSEMEHHSNLVPWLQLRERRGFDIDWIGIDTEGELSIESLKTILQKGNTKLVAVTGLSNVLGSMPDIHAITQLAHAHGALVLVDGAQMIAHMPMNVRSLDCDFFAFSGHKVYGPMGVGVLYGKSKILDALPSFLGGGDMVASVSTTGFTPAELPRKFEAGTISAVDAIGLGVALSWLSETDASEREQYEQELMEHALTRLQTVKGLHILGTKDATKRRGVISFTVDGVHPHDLTAMLGQRGICLRAGHHCAEPLHEALGINASARLSLGIYNSKEDIDTCVHGIQDACSFFTTR